MVRVTREGGTVAVVDMFADEDPDVAAEMNRLERLHDPSHNRALTESEITAMVTAAGTRPRRRVSRDQPLELTDWLERTQTPTSVCCEVVDRFDAEISGGPATGLHPSHVDDGAWWFVHTGGKVLRVRVSRRGRSVSGGCAWCDAGRTRCRSR